MKLSKEKMLEIAVRKEKCIKCDMENCVKCDNFVCANKAWGEGVEFFEKVRELLQADAEGRLVVLPFMKNTGVALSGLRERPEKNMKSCMVIS